MLLSNLLPYDKKTKTGAAFKKGLFEFLYVLNCLEKTVIAYKENGHEDFDALVGENACHIRALAVCHIFGRSIVRVSYLEDQLVVLKNRIATLLEDKNIIKLMAEGISLKSAIETFELDIVILKEECYLFCCYLLKQVREASTRVVYQKGLTLKEKSVSKKVKFFGQVSSSFTHKIVNSLRKHLSHATVEFVREIASKSGDEQIIRMVSDEFSILHNDCLMTVPMFWACKAVLCILKKEPIEVALEVDILECVDGCYSVVGKQSFKVKKTALTGDLETILKLEKREVTTKTNMPCMVFKGAACVSASPNSIERWEEKILSFTFDTIFLSGAADHRQYPDVFQSNQLVSELQDHEHESYASFAKNHGFAESNPSTFFIQHVYAENMANLPSLNEVFSTV